MKEIQKIKDKLELYVETEKWFNNIRQFLINEYRIDVKDGSRYNNTVTCRYVITFMLSQRGVSNIFIHELFGYAVPSTVSTGLKKAVFFHNTKDTLFMGWYSIIKDRG